MPTKTNYWSRVHLQRRIRRHTFRKASPRSTVWKVPVKPRAMLLEAAAAAHDSSAAVEKVGHNSAGAIH